MIYNTSSSAGYTVTGTIQLLSGSKCSCQTVSSMLHWGKKALTQCCFGYTTHILPSTECEEVYSACVSEVWHWKSCWRRPAVHSGLKSTFLMTYEDCFQPLLNLHSNSHSKSFDFCIDCLHMEGFSINKAHRDRSADFYKKKISFLCCFIMNKALVCSDLSLDPTGSKLLHKNNHKIP